MIIDIHSHYLPIPYLEEVGRHGKKYGVKVHLEGDDYILTMKEYSFGKRTEEIFTLDKRLLHMKKVGIDCMALSLAAPNVYWAPPDLGYRLSRLVNDSIHQACLHHLGQFVGLASVPLQDMEASLEELKRAVGQLGFKGVLMGTNINGVDLDSPSFYPFYEQVEALGVLIFVHPGNHLGFQRLKDYRLDNLVGNPFETTVAISRMIFGGVFDLFPGLKVVFSHLGGAAPFLIGRFSQGYDAFSVSRKSSHLPHTYFQKNIYVDTICFNPKALSYTYGVMGGSQILAGTDYPFNMGDFNPREIVSEAEGIPKEDKDRILGKNAALLLGL